MKKKQDLSPLIQAIKPKTISDEIKIAEYCSNRELFVNFQKSPTSNISVSFDEFTYWTEIGLPKVGNVVMYEQHYTLGIISSIDDECIHLGVSILNGDGLITSDIKRPKTGFRYATDDEILNIHQALAQKGYTWNIWRNIFVKRMLFPRPYMFVKFRSYISENCGVGIFREIDQEGMLVMYCAACNKGKARYSLCEKIGPAHMFQLAQGNRTDMYNLKTALEETGRTWNFHYNRVEPLNFNIDYGETYYYINEGGEILKAKKNDSAAYRKRLAFGNHFTQLEYAEKFKANILEKRNLQLALEESSDTPSPASSHNEPKHRQDRPTRTKMKSFTI